MAHDARAIANKMLDIARAKGIALTPMHILKLVYIAHGWNLAIHDKPLVRDNIEAWRFGPVIRSVYDAFKVFGTDPIDETLRYVPEERMSTEEQALLERVVDVYGRHEAFRLSSLTHKEGTPWDTVWNRQRGDRQRGAVIPDSLIKQHFLELGRKHARSA